MNYILISNFNYFREQESQLNHLLREVASQNPTMIPALIYPEPLLEKKIPVVLLPGGPSYVCEVLQYTWQYFAMLPGARAYLKDFLGIENSKPRYNTEFKETDRKMDTTGYDRYYQYQMSGFSLHKPEEFKKGSQDSASANR